MKKLIMAIAIALTALGVAVYAQGPGYGPGWGRGGGGGWGPGMGLGMMGGYGPGPCGDPEYGAWGEGISIDRAKEVANGYAEKYMKGFTVERVLPYTGMRHTMYEAELKGPNDEVRYLRINPWGGVMPFASGRGPGW